ncbi:MAG: amidohydrolase family protein [Chloroherpetonaceae bacterium]|nr:amidohydrolase [Chthonomonadaceae bacterium]MDW8207560.1 amidohydrolase family protein [Chloroherpetonaceae bacterium]
MTLRHSIRDLVAQTPFIDTHEHLVEESRRVHGVLHPALFPCDDWSLLFYHYTGDDLLSAGMPAEDRKRLFAPDTPSEEKYHLLEPWWQRVRHTGYGQAVRHTLRLLYSEEDLTAASLPRIAEKYRALICPGFYAQVLRQKACVEHCQVNSLERIFMETEQPDLLRQDLSTVALSSGLDRDEVERQSGQNADTLEGWLQVIDWHFERYGPRAVATKNQSAYNRRLDYTPVARSEAEVLFARLARGEALSPVESKRLQDFLMRYCIQKATEYGLPVKLHTGYYAGIAHMPLERVRQNASDLCPLLRDFPDTRFVLMHIGYPYQDEFIALAKHYPNVTIDLCWAWIINPTACVRFVKEFLTAVPASKLLTFGGDYLTVEPVCGHAEIARMGLTQALTELVEEGWLPREELPGVIELLMRGNARALFPDRTPTSP